MKVATWNVNSIRVRRDRVLTWLEARQPDVLCLQELKTVDSDFPLEAVRSVGYHAVTWGQRTYNGVAIISKEEPVDVVRGFGDGGDDSQARFIAATIAGVRVVSGYIPNGQRMTSDKYPYKIEWYRRLKRWLEANCSPGGPVLVCGDFNVALTDADVGPGEWEGGVLYNPEIVGMLEDLMSWGLTDVFRIHNPEPGQYSWWDYRQAAFERDSGMRIDYIFATQPLVDAAVASFIDKDERIEVENDKPSDHAPVVATFDYTGQPSQGMLL